jgi:2-C-methyl-D-erythritol 4-phosphate cytidylyltransferase
MTTDSVWAVVPAAGIGSRMQADRPKQYLEIDNKTVLERTLERLATHPKIKGIVISLAEHDAWWPQLSLDLLCPVHIVEGGEERYHSVLNALTFLSEQQHNDDWVLVHDAARPCLRHQDIDLMLETLNKDAVGGILGIPVTDTVKRVDENNVITDTVCR